MMNDQTTPIDADCYAAILSNTVEDTTVGITGIVVDFILEDDNQLLRFVAHAMAKRTYFTQQFYDDQIDRSRYAYNLGLRNDFWITKITICPFDSVLRAVVEFEFVKP